MLVLHALSRRPLFVIRLKLVAPAAASAVSAAVSEYRRKCWKPGSVVTVRLLHSQRLVARMLDMHHGDSYEAHRANLLRAERLMRGSALRVARADR